MERALRTLASEPFDLLIIGGGIFGVCAAWDAALRGLKVALIERHDFSSGASANCYKIAHGGLRYLQHGDLRRTRASSKDQCALLRIAPHQVKPLPIVVPTYGHGKKGKEMLFAGLSAYHLLTAGKNRGIRDVTRRIGPGRTLDAAEVLDLFPGLDRAGLTGGVMFQDGQIYSPPRLAVTFLRSAVDKGAVAANHTEAIDYLRDGEKVTGVRARDRLTGDEFDVRASCTLNATGGWSDRLNASLLGRRTDTQTVFSRDACFVVPRKFSHPYALAVSAQTRDPDALLSREARHLFVVPWRNRTIVGVWHKVVTERPEEVGLTEAEVQAFIDEVQTSYPALDLDLGDVMHTNYGLVPFGENEPDSPDLSYGKRSLLVDHARHHGIEGLVTLVGVRYTVARSDAARAIDLIAARLGRSAPAPATDRIPLHGGEFDSFETLTAEIAEKLGECGGSSERARALAHNYGSAYGEVLGNAESRQSVGDSHTLCGEIAHAVRAEMAMTLDDVVYRRTDLGSGGIDAITLESASKIMASLCGWSEERRLKEQAFSAGITGLAATPSIFGDRQ